MIASYNFYFCYVEVYKDYVKSIMKEGVTVVPEHNDILLLVVEKHFKNRPFIYISHRINSYAVNPTVYIEISKIPNIIGLAVVSNDPKQREQTKLEKAFFKKEFKFFDNLSAALLWKNEMIYKYSYKEG